MWDTYSFARKVLLEAYNLEIPGDLKDIDVLRDIAAGKVTIRDPGDLGAKVPKLKEYLARRAGPRIQADRTLATGILEGLNRIIGKRRE